MLEHFTADVQAQVLAVHHAPDEAEVLGQQILAVFHDHHTGGIELQTPLEVFGIVVVGCLAGNKQQGLKADASLGADMDPAQGLLVVEELFPVECVILRIGHIVLAPLPDGHHGVQGLHLGVGFVLVGIFLLAGLGDLHTDGIADIIGILTDQLPQGVLLQERRELRFLAVVFQHHDHISAGGSFFTFLDGVAIGTV